MKKYHDMSKPFEISKELENINFRNILVQFPELKRNKKEISQITRRKKQRRWFIRKKVCPLNKKKDTDPKTQVEAFQEAMKLLLITGQCLGLNPVRGVLVTDVSKIRLSVFNWRFLYCITIGLMQATGTILIVYRQSKIPYSITNIGNCAFYITTCITTFMYLSLGTKWPWLMRELANCSLNEYIDRSIKFKCNTACIVIFILGAVEHILALISKTTSINDCWPDADVYFEYQRQTFAWYYDLGLPYSTVMAIIIQFMNILNTFNWNYSDLYIICLSFYLVSILQRINEKIMLACKKDVLPQTYWRLLREDYQRATRLLRSFDDVISGIVFCSFASNLFFVCQQLFHVLKHGLNTNDHFHSKCKNFKRGLFFGYEFTIYAGYSVIYILARSLAAALIAANAHSTSLETAIALYNVPATSFCPEVARFLDLVHTDTVALSGLRFFYVTRELVLSVVGTIVTYELVMLQVGDNEPA